MSMKDNRRFWKPYNDYMDSIGSGRTSGATPEIIEAVRFDFAEANNTSIPELPKVGNKFRFKGELCTVTRIGYASFFYETETDKKKNRYISFMYWFINTIIRKRGITLKFK